MQDKTFSNANLGCAYPALTVNKSDTKDVNGINRYYAKPIIIFNKNYYLCKEWYENDKKRLVPWLKNKLGMTS